MSSATDQPAERRRAPRGRLNKKVIVKAAMTLIDSEGLEALTMGRLARDLEVRPMSLYTHFRDKSSILQAVAVQVCDKFEMPKRAANDIDSLRNILRAYFRLMVDNPVLLQFYTTGEETTTGERIAEAIYGCVHRMGFDHRTSISFVGALHRFVVGAAFTYPTGQAWDSDPRRRERLFQLWTGLPPEAYPTLNQLSRDYPVVTQDEIFEFGLEKLLESIVRTAAEKSSR